MKRQVIICEIGLDDNVDSKTINTIMQLLKTNNNMPHVTYVDAFIDDVDEEE